MSKLVLVTMTMFLSSCLNSELAQHRRNLEETHENLISIKQNIDRLIEQRNELYKQLQECKARR